MVHDNFHLLFSVIKLRVRASGSRSQVPPKTEKSADIPMGTNQAYESVDVRYQAGGRRNQEGEEAIYELPAI